MIRLHLIIFAVFAFILLCNGEDATAETSSADELSKEEIYNINTDMYCQTELVIKKKLLDLEDPVNLYTSTIGDDIAEIDCEAVLAEYVKRVHKRLHKDFMKKGSSLLSVGCFTKKVKELGYDQMRFKFNALYGIEIESEKKNVLRKAIDKEIGETVEKAVDYCWPVDPANPNVKVNGETANHTSL